MTVQEQFIGLNGLVVSREEIARVIDAAKSENDSCVIYRLSRALNKYPDKETFEISIAEFPESGLNAPRHKGSYKVALDDCGRLKPGFRFVGGQIVQSVKKAKKVKAFKPKSVSQSNKKKVEKLAPAKVNEIEVVLPSKEKKAVVKNEAVAKKESQLSLFETKKEKPKPALRSPETKNKNISDLEKLGFVSAAEVPAAAENVFVLPGEIGKFIQKIQPHKALILIKGTKHTSKSQLAMQIANAFAENEMPVAYIDYEQGGMVCKDTVDSINRNTSEKGRKMIAVKGYLEKPLEELKGFCKYCKVIVADSVTDLGITADQLNELRNEFPEVIWVFISQVKDNGEMYGGNKMAHNPTAIIKCHPAHDPKERYATLEKNRGNDLSLKYSMYDKKIIIPQVEELKQETNYKPVKFSFDIIEN